MPIVNQIASRCWKSRRANSNHIPDSTYNTERPHSRLGWMSPSTYAAARRSAAPRYTDGSAPRTAATTRPSGHHRPPDSNSDWIKKGGSVTNAAGWRFAMARSRVPFMSAISGHRANRAPGSCRQSDPDRRRFARRRVTRRLPTVAPFLLNILRARICYALSNTRVLRLVQNAMDHPRR
jgi:hypothetical protein